MTYTELYVQYSYAVLDQKRDLRQASRFFGRYYPEFLRIYSRIKEIKEKADQLTKQKETAYMAALTKALDDNLAALTTDLNNAINRGEFWDKGTIKIGNFTYYGEVGTYLQEDGKIISREIPGMPLQAGQVNIVEQTFKMTRANGKLIKLNELTPVLASEPGIYEATKYNIAVAQQFLRKGAEALRLNAVSAQGITGVILIQLLNF